MSAEELRARLERAEAAVARWNDFFRMHGEPDANEREQKCRACGAGVVFVKSAKTGKAMPCDAAMLTVVDAEGNIVRGRVSHFATCPASAEFRKRT